MVPFKNGFTLFYFSVIFLTINMVHAAPNDDDILQSLHDDYHICMNEIRFAFKSDSCSDCFKYAIVHYKKGEFIPGNLEQQKIFTSYLNQQQNAASTSNQNQDFGSIQTKQKHEDPTPIYPPGYYNVVDSSSTYIPGYYNVVDSSSTYIPEQKHEDPTPIYPPGYYNVVDSSSPYNNPEQTYVDPTPINPPDDNINDRRFDGQMSSGPEAGYNFDFSDIPLFIDGFDGLENFIKKDQNIYSQRYDGQTSSGQEASHNFEVSVLDEHLYPSNYAKAYFNQLENLAQGGKVLTPSQYCHDTFENDPNCTNALKIFGRTSKSAVTVSLTKFKLSDCAEELYKYAYMEHILSVIEIIRPSKQPKSFCREIYQKSDWYMQLKGYK